IFDLDDTLIDTSGTIMPFKLHLALTRMVEAGLKIDSFEKAYELMQQLNSKAEATRQTLSALLSHYQAPNSFFDIALQALVEPLPEDFIVKTWRQTAHVLSELKKNHFLAIVTMGDPHFQMEKIKKAGLEPTLFCKIAVAQMESKKSHYKSLMDELGLLPKQVVVVGDRIGNDLTPAKELGATTVHLMKGRGKNSQGPKEHVDFTISEIEELMGVL
ncbi:MAG TPA: HAD family hydrolase, partial [Rhabdochlamydiaceae bacterium]|nr:HAD family hydrolase [Rhabdochlamydiaceae bacterium]